MNGTARTSSFCCVILAFGVFATMARAEDTTHAWQRWEHAFVSAKAYANPCTDVTLRVRFDGPQGQSREGLGFWDGSARFVIRCAFPAPGLWRWSTTCSDETNAGLHKQSGSVQVKPPRTENPLTRHGYLRVSDDHRLLVYADGAPFLWIGDTCWAAPAHATAQDWKHYVTGRAAQGYSVLQLAVGPDWALKTARRADMPFLSKLPDITKPNPVYFQDMDRKLAVANDQGMVVMMCGLMETPYRYPPPEQIAVLSRYIAARYSSFEVIFSPSFDSGIREAETVAAATAVREAAPANLITMHMGTGVGPHFHTADWLSFDMVQSGHNGGDRVRQSIRAIGMPAEDLALKPRKPVINGEAIYEGDLGAAYDVRRTAWLSMLSGAAGYTAGINEIHTWEDDAAAKMYQPSSAQVSLLAHVLRALPWWTLEPAPGRILHQPEDFSEHRAFVLTSDKTLGIAYLPANKTITLNLSECAARYVVTWINPASGEPRDGATAVAAPETTMSAPDNRDWVLLLAAPSAAPAAVQAAKALAKYARPPKRQEAAIRFAKRAPVEGLVRKSPRDGAWSYSTYHGMECIVNEKPKQTSYLYIDVDDRLAFRGGVRQMRVEATLQSDEALDGLQLQYDAEGPNDNAYIYRSVPPAWRKNKGPWTTVGFVAEAPYLGGRQNSGADFRIFINNHPCHAASVKVTLDPAPARTP